MANYGEQVAAGPETQSMQQVFVNQYHYQLHQQLQQHLEQQQQHQYQQQQQQPESNCNCSLSNSTVINIPIDDLSETSSISTDTTVTTLALTIPNQIDLGEEIQIPSTVYGAGAPCCTRYAERIYMQRCSLDMVDQQQPQPQHPQHPQHQQQEQHHEEHPTVEQLQQQQLQLAHKILEQQQQQQQQYYDDNDDEYYKADHHKKSFPFFIILISLLEISIFVYDYLTVPKSLQQQQNQDMLPVPIPTDSVFIYRPDRRLEVWRFVSYMFLHANFFHLGFNVVVQLFYGIPLEVMHGSTRVAIIYFAGVFAGSLGTSVVDSEVYLVGASGGVYALLAAHLANITLNYGQMRYAVAQLLSVVIFVACDLAYAFYTQYLAVDIVSKAPPVSYIAHLTGALAGLTIGLLVLKNFEKRAYENVIWWLALGVYSAFTVFAIVFNLINTVTAQLIEEQSEVITQHLLHDLGVS